jgi:DNA-binding transcriptional MerR regulator
VRRGQAGAEREREAMAREKPRKRTMTKAADAFKTISEVACELDVPKHVLRFWEGKFTQIRPLKRGGGRRYYRPEDVDLLRAIRVLLHRDGYTIKGVQKLLREQGVDSVKSRLSAGAAAPSRGRADGKSRPAPVSSQSPRARSQGNRRAAAGDSGRPQVNPTSADIIAAALAELERCRALLKGEVPAAGEARHREEIR